MYGALATTRFETANGEDGVGVRAARRARAGRSPRATTSATFSPGRADRAGRRTRPSPGGRFIRALARFEKPLVAAIEGQAVGIGTTLCFHCDLVYAAPSARFRMPFVNLGLVPEAGSSMLAAERFGSGARAPNCCMLAESLRRGQGARDRPRQRGRRLRKTCSPMRWRKRRRWRPSRARPCSRRAG